MFLRAECMQFDLLYCLIISDLRYLLHKSKKMDYNIARLIFFDL